MLPKFQLINHVVDFYKALTIYFFLATILFLILSFDDVTGEQIIISCRTDINILQKISTSIDIRTNLRISSVINLFVATIAENQWRHVRYLLRGERSPLVKSEAISNSSLLLLYLIFSLAWDNTQSLQACHHSENLNRLYYILLAHKMISLMLSISNVFALNTIIVYFVGPDYQIT